jgi:hypothetical protein
MTAGSGLGPHILRMLSFLATLFSLPLPGMFSKQRLHTQRASGLEFSFDIWGCKWNNTP